MVHEKAYDSKSNMWSLGCLMYELCARYLLVVGMRIPPLPRGYSQALTSIIKSMLNLNVSFPKFLTDSSYQLRI